MKPGELLVIKDQILSYIQESDIVFNYFNIKELPTVITSPIRKDEKPSFGIFLTSDNKIRYRDFSTGEKGDIWDLLGIYFGLSYSKVFELVYKEMILGMNLNKSGVINPWTNYSKDKIRSNRSIVKCRIREWKDYDLTYWNSYGIDINWLRYADVYPINYMIIIKNGTSYIFKADKYAYAYIERKENNITMKIYQPFNIKGHKWTNGNDKTVISLWTKIPDKGDKLVICASLKDALCLSANINIPAIAPQGEGYKLSNTACTVLKSRYKQIYILLDNDKAGLEDAKKLAELTGFTNIILPDKGAKDVSDLYKKVGKYEFKKIIMPLFSNNN